MKKIVRRIVLFLLSSIMSLSLVCGIFAIANETTNTTPTVINPIAKYEFKDKDNLGKDSMGNYDMGYVKKWVSGATGPILDKYTAVDEVNGGVTFNGEFCLAQNAEHNMFADVSAFTLCFEIKTGPSITSWQHYIGVGGTKYGFSVVNGDTRESLNYTARLQAPEINGTYWSSEALIAPKTDMSEYQKVVLSVQPGIALSAYLNGNLIVLNKTTVLEDSVLGSDGSYLFSIGAVCSSAYVATQMSAGSIRNVQFYDFAMDATCVTAYNTKNQITTEDTVNLPFINGFESVLFDGEPTSVQLITTMTTDKMLKALNPAKAKFKLSNGLFINAPITWDCVEVVNGEYYAKGTANTNKLGLVNKYGNDVSYKLEVNTATISGTVINPIAKYEFKDKNNLGKDSMGNFDMEYKRLWVAGATGALLNTYTAVDEVNGGVTFDGEFCLAQDKNRNMFANVSAFTLCFEMKTGDYVGSWQHYLGVGGDNGISVIGVDGKESNRYKARLQVPQVNGTYWSSEDLLGDGKPMTEYQSVVIVVAPSGNLGIYVNGKAIQTTKNTVIPEDFTTGKDGYLFSIGGTYNGAVTRTASGSIRNVQFYDFPMDATCVSAYNVYGQITTIDAVNLPVVKSLGEVVFDGEPTNKILSASMGEEEILSYLNSARGKLTLSNDLVISSPIKWERIEIENGDYYAVGSITNNLGYKNDCGTEFSYKLEVLNFKKLSEPKFGGTLYKGELENYMTEAEMLALLNVPTVTITFLDDTTQDVLVPLSKIVLERDKYVAYGDVIYNDTLYGTISIVLDVSLYKEILSTNYVMSFALLSDTHCTSSWINGTFLSSLADAKKERLDLSHAIVLGDLSDNGLSATNSSVNDLNNYYDWLDNYDYKNSKGVKIPIYNILGNHDVRGPSAEGYPQSSYPLAVETYLEREGVETLQWDTWIKGYHFIFLNTDEYHKDYAVFNKDTIKWLDETLAEKEDGRPIFVMLHQNIEHVETNDDASMTFEEVIARHPSAIVSSGHTHHAFGENSIINEGNGVYINQPAMFVADAQYYIVDVYEGGVIYRARECSTNTWVIASDVVVEDSNYSPEEQPNEPNEPDAPIEPNEPIEPDNPDNPDNPSTDNGDKEEPNGGDNEKKGCGSNILTEAIIIATITLVAAIIFISRKQRFE